LAALGIGAESAATGVATTAAGACLKEERACVSGTDTIRTNLGLENNQSIDILGILQIQNMLNKHQE